MSRCNFKSTALTSLRYVDPSFFAVVYLLPFVSFYNIQNNKHCYRDALFYVSEFMK